MMSIMRSVKIQTTVTDLLHAISMQLINKSREIRVICLVICERFVCLHVVNITILVDKMIWRYEEPNYDNNNKVLYIGGIKLVSHNPDMQDNYCIST